MKRYKPQKSVAFTLIEIIIVVSILGIITAIVFPQFSQSTEKAKEAAAKEMLQTMRSQIELYAIQNNGVPPGYKDNDPYTTPGELYFTSQLTVKNKYLSSIPKNPFNENDYIHVITTNESLESISVPAKAGWIYNPESKNIYLYKLGTDSKGIKYLDY